MKYIHLTCLLNHSFASPYKPLSDRDFFFLTSRHRRQSEESWGLHSWQILYMLGCLHPDMPFMQTFSGEVRSHSRALSNAFHISLSSVSAYWSVCPQATLVSRHTNQFLMISNLNYLSGVLLVSACTWTEGDLF